MLIGPGHIEWHLESGLAMTFIEAPLQMQQQLQLPAFIGAACEASGLPSKGNAGASPPSFLIIVLKDYVIVGKFSATDLAGLAVGPYPQILES